MCGIDGIVRRRNDGTVLAIGTQDREFGEKEDGCVVAWDDGRVSFAPIWNRRFTAIP
jgi:hypothetical protein